MCIHLETERLVLRELTTEDVDHLVALDTDPDLARWSMDPIPSREDVEQRHVPCIGSRDSTFQVPSPPTSSNANLVAR